MLKKLFLLLLYALLGAFLCIGLAGCGKKDEVPGIVSKEYNVFFHKVSVPSDVGYQLRFSENKLYYRAYDSDLQVWGIRRIDVDSDSSQEFLKWDPADEESLKWSVCCFDTTKDGGIVALLEKYAGNAEGSGSAKEYVLAEYDSKGKKTGSWTIEKDVIPNSTFLPVLGADRKGNVCIAADEKLVLLTEGVKKGELSLAKGENVINFAKSSDDILYAYVSGGAKSHVERICFSPTETKTAENLPQGVFGIGETVEDKTSGAKGGVLIFSNEYLFLMDTDEKTLPLAEWAAVDIYGTDIRYVGLFGETIYVFSGKDAKEGEVAVLKPKGEKNGEQTKEATETKQVLKLAVLSKSSRLSNLVSDYNRSQDKYKVEIVNYGKGTSSSAEWQAPINRMMADLLGDDSPDLIDLCNFYVLNLDPAFEDFLNKGYVVDLKPYLEQSTRLKREDFEEKVLDLFTGSKGLSAIPTTYTLNAILTSSNTFGGKKGISVSELIAYDHAHPDMEPIECCSRWDIYWLCLLPNESFFVDFENKKACFDCPEFREIMEYAISYPKSDGQYVPFSGNQFLMMEPIDSLYNVQLARNTYFGTDGIFMGYPSVDGAPLYYIEPSADAVALAITGRSDKKDGAWDFLEYSLTRKYISEREYMALYGGMESNKACFQENLEALAASDGPLKPGGLMRIENTWEYEPYPFTEEERDLFYDILNTARVKDQRMKKVENLVREEIDAYFSGQKSLDQTIEIIQSRVQLYLDER